jgi:hypothetical protein
MTHGNGPAQEHTKEFQGVSAGSGNRQLFQVSVEAFRVLSGDKQIMASFWSMQEGELGPKLPIASVTESLLRCGDIAL